MNDIETIEILRGLLENDYLSEKEKEAVREAIGVLAWAKLSEGNMKARKDAHDKKIADGSESSFE